MNIWDNQDSERQFWEASAREQVASRARRLLDRGVYEAVDSAVAADGAPEEHASRGFPFSWVLPAGCHGQEVGK